MSGRNAVAFPYETELLSTVDQPCVRCEWVNSQKRRDLPTPGSPTTATTWPCPAPARSRAWRSCSSSGSRPTKRVRPRSAAACSRERTVPAPTTSSPPSGAWTPGPGDHSPLKWGVHPLDRLGAEGLHHDVAFRQIQRRGRDKDRPRHGHLLQARRQVGGLADGRGVHVDAVG